MFEWQGIVIDCWMPHPGNIQEAWKMEGACTYSGVVQCCTGAGQSAALHGCQAIGSSPQKVKTGFHC